MVLGELAQRLGQRHGVACRAVGALAHEGDRRRAGEQVLEVEVELLGGEAHQRVLVDPVLAAGVAQRTAQLGECGHVQAAVLGQDDGFGRRQSFTNLVDDRGLLGPDGGVVRHARSPPWRFGSKSGSGPLVPTPQGLVGFAHRGPATGTTARTDSEALLLRRSGSPGGAVTRSALDATARSSVSDSIVVGRLAAHGVATTCRHPPVLPATRRCWRGRSGRSGPWWTTPRPS